MKINKLSIVIPCYNESTTIEKLLALVEAVDLGHTQKEIIVVDDGSSDGTREILQNYSDKYKVIFHEKNQGKGAALRTGFSYASGDFIVVQDADLEYDPRDFKKMVARAEAEDLRAVFGSRVLAKNPKAGPLYYLGGRVLSFVTNLLYGTHITDEPTCYKMFKTCLLEKFKIESNGFEFCPEIVAKIARQGIPIKEVPISYYPRGKKEGKKIKLKDAFIAVWTLIKYRIK